MVTCYVVIGLTLQILATCFQLCMTRKQRNDHPHIGKRLQHILRQGYSFCFLIWAVYLTLLTYFNYIIKQAFKNDVLFVCTLFRFVMFYLSYLYLFSLIGFQLGLLSANVRVMDTSSTTFGAVMYYPSGAPMLIPGFYWNSSWSIVIFMLSNLPNIRCLFIWQLHCLSFDLLFPLIPSSIFSFN